MQTYFYKLSGGINQAESKTALGLDTKKMYWSDSKNVEILQNTGLIRQKGNTLFCKLENEEKITGLHEMIDIEGSAHNLLISTVSGKLLLFLEKSQTFLTLNKILNGAANVNFVDFLDGVVGGSKKDALFYINNDSDYLVESCNLNDSNGNPIYADVFAVFADRLWVASGATLYYSALGKYNDFSTANDAGYINNFYIDTNDITALKIYKNYLAIYKENSVYLLSGSNNSDFAITPFADKGTPSFASVVTVNNKQYFVNQGVFTLEQAGLLSQIQLGEEISLNIKPEFCYFDKNKFDEIIVLNYEIKNQIWFFIPYKNDNYFHIIWIYDYIEQAWFKRVLPQDIVKTCVYNGYILTADVTGKVFIEDLGTSFNGEPISFMWKSPFLASGDSNIRKTIDEFYFVLDENYDNKFNFSVCKDYDSISKSDEDSIYSSNLDNLIWDSDSNSSSLISTWSFDAENSSESIYAQWATGAEAVYKAEISESNYSVQLCVEGDSIDEGFAIIGLEFKEIYPDV